MNFPKNAPKHQKPIVNLNVTHFEEKNSFYQYLSPFNGLIKKFCLKNLNFLLDFPLFKHVEKNKFLCISVLLSEKVNFLSKKKYFL